MLEPNREMAHCPRIMTRTLPVLINRSGGTAAAMGPDIVFAVEQAFADLGQPIELELLPGQAIASAVARHAGKPLVAVGGGGGTLGTAASVLAGKSAAMAILPLGTRNHLARQLGVPLDLAGAARLALSGRRRRIDIGQAGEGADGRVFVNNASFGIYSRFVHHRDRGKGPKWLSSIPATWHALRHMRAQRFRLRIDRRSEELVTPLLFVGNNECSMALGQLGQREALDDDRLSIRAVSAKTPRQLLGFGARAAVGMAHPERDFETHGTAREILIEGQGLIEGAFDGELAALPLPLRLRSLSAALGVVTPHETASAAQALLPSRSRTL